MTTTTRPHPEWITPAELARDMGRTERWVADKMASGELPSVKVGQFRWFTPGCMAELEARQLRASGAPDPGLQPGWGRATRGRSA